MKQSIKDHIAIAIDWIGAILYYPVYVSGWILHKVARFLLGIAYTMMLEFQKATDIFTNFLGHGRKLRK